MRKILAGSAFRSPSRRFRKSSKPPNRARLQRIALWLIHLLDPLIRLESLYRYLRKFHALSERRYVVLCAHHIPAALMVLLSLEFVPRPRQTRSG